MTPRNGVAGFVLVRRIGMVEITEVGPSRELRIEMRTLLAAGFFRCGPKASVFSVLEQFRKSPSDTGGPMREAGKILLALHRRNPHRIPRPASSAFFRQEQQGFAIVNAEPDNRIVVPPNAHLDKWWNSAPTSAGHIQGSS